MVTAGLGMYGPYVKHEKTYKSLDKTDDILTVTMERAIELLAQAKTKAVVVPLKELGPHPDDKEPVQIFDGRYGAYVKHGKVNATLPKGTDPQAFTIEEALPLLAERAARGPAPKKGRGRGRTSSAAADTTDAPVKKKAAKKATKKAAKKKKPDEE